MNCCPFYQGNVGTRFSEISSAIENFGILCTSPNAFPDLGAVSSLVVDLGFPILDG
jgi:hypothetical protein